jgi:hypothetical protein
MESWTLAAVEKLSFHLCWGRKVCGASARIQHQITKPENATAEAPADAPRFHMSMQPAKFALCNLHLNRGKAVKCGFAVAQRSTLTLSRPGQAPFAGKASNDSKEGQRNCFVALCMCQRMAQVDQRGMAAGKCCAEQPWTWIYPGSHRHEYPFRLPLLPRSQATNTQMKFQIHFIESSCPYSYHHWSSLPYRSLLLQVTPQFLL